MGLFRTEVFEAHQTSNMGSVVLQQTTPIYVIVTLILFTFGVGVFFLADAEYARRETVQGYLVPEKGLSKVYSGRDGVVEKLIVQEGQLVQRGDILLTIRNSESLLSGEELSAQLASNTRSQLLALRKQLSNVHSMYTASVSSLESKILTLNEALRSVSSTKTVSNKKLQITKLRLDNSKKLYDKGYLSSNQINYFEEEFLDSEILVDEAEQLENEISIKINDAETVLAELPYNRDLKLSALTQEILVLESRLIELESQYKFVEKAPEDGVVTAIRINEGRRVTVNTPLMSVIPKDSPLVLEMLLPSRSAGFVKLGNKVNIRLDAFPYQKFGFLEGEVIHIDKALLLPGDDTLPIEISQAMYRIKARLPAQHFQALGTSFQLKIGMLAEADIILESRTIFEWLMEPVYSVKGRL